MIRREETIDDNKIISNFIFHCILFFVEVDRNFSDLMSVSGLKLRRYKERYGRAVPFSQYSIFIRETCIIEKCMYTLARQQDPHYLLSYMCVDVAYKGGLRGLTCFVGSQNRIVVNTHCETRVTLNNKSISRDKDGP